MYQFNNVYRRSIIGLLMLSLSGTALCQGDARRLDVSLKLTAVSRTTEVSHQQRTLGQKRVESHDTQSVRPTVKADFKGVSIGQSLSDAIGALQRAGYTYGYNWANKDNEDQVESHVMHYAGDRTGYISYLNNVPQSQRANNDGTCPYMTQIHFFTDAGGAVLCGTDEAGKGFDFKLSKVVRIVGFVDIPQGESVGAFLESARRKYPDLPASPGFRDGVSYRINNPQDPVVLISISDSAYGEVLMSSVRRDAEASSTASF